MSQRKAVTRATATRYRSASKGPKAVIVDELCQLTGWHRDHARKALRRALGPRRVLAPRKVRPPTYGEDVMVALRRVLAVMDALAGKASVAVPGRDRGAVAGLWGTGPRRPDNGEGVRDVGGHDRSAPGRGTLTAGAQGPLGDQTRVVVEVPDPDPDLG